MYLVEPFLLEGKGNKIVIKAAIAPDGYLAVIITP